MSIFTMGIDVGSTASKCVIIKDGKEIVSTAVISVGTGTSGPARAMKEALEKVGLTSVDQLQGAVATGYGRNSIAEVPAQMSELSCHAKGAYFLFPNVHSIVDIGGQDSKALKVGDNGMLENFVMNDKCAAGTGRFLDVIAKVLEVGLEDLEKLDEKSTVDVPISSTCTVFAESEVISQLANGTKIPDLVAGICKSVAARVASLAKRIGIKEQVCMSGGVARNAGVRLALEKELNTSIAYSDKAQLMGALGAAIYGLKKDN